MLHAGNTCKAKWLFLCFRVMMSQEPVHVFQDITKFIYVKSIWIAFNFHWTVNSFSCALERYFQRISDASNRCILLISISLIIFWPSTSTFISNYNIYTFRQFIALYVIYRAYTKEWCSRHLFTFDTAPLFCVCPVHYKAHVSCSCAKIFRWWRFRYWNT